jgi:hypothetical protein
MFVSSSGIDTAATAAKAGQSNTGPCLVLYPTKMINTTTIPSTTCCGKPENRIFNRVGEKFYFL